MFQPGSNMRLELWIGILGNGKTHFKHVLCALRLGAVDGEGVVRVVNCAPVIEDGLERGLNFPVFDQILDELWKGARFVVLLLC